MTAGKKSPKNDAAKKLVSFLKDIFRLSKDTLIAAVILGVLGYFFSSYIAFRQHNLDLYDTLTAKVMDLAFADEILYVFCVNDKASQPDKSQVANSLKEVELFKVRLQLSDKFFNLIQAKQNLGIFLSYDDFYKLHQLTYWTNAVITSEKGICNSGLLVAPKVLDAWLTTLRNDLAKSRALHKQRLQSLKDYFLSVFSDVEANYYVAPVDLKELPIYQNTLTEKE